MSNEALVFKMGRLARLARLVLYRLNDTDSKLEDLQVGWKGIEHACRGGSPACMRISGYILKISQAPVCRSY